MKQSHAIQQISKFSFSQFQIRIYTSGATGSNLVAVAFLEYPLIPKN